MTKPVTKLEKFYWWCDRWLWWTVNGWFAAKATQMMSDRTEIIHDPTFIKSERALDAQKTEIERLETAIRVYLSGNYSQTKKYELCKHDVYGYECCEKCIDEYFEGILNPKR